LAAVKHAYLVEHHYSWISLFHFEEHVLSDCVLEADTWRLVAAVADLVGHWHPRFWPLQRL